MLELAVVFAKEADERDDQENPFGLEEVDEE